MESGNETTKMLTIITYGWQDFKGVLIFFIVLFFSKYVIFKVQISRRKIKIPLVSLEPRNLKFLLTLLF
jgi:hypothetical protein